MTEALKLGLATQLHRRELMAAGFSSGPNGIAASFRRTATPRLIIATATIAVMYTANNLLSYFCIAQMGE